MADRWSLPGHPGLAGCGPDAPALLPQLHEPLMLTREEQSDLIDLTWHRETAYTFSVVDGIWTATPADNPAGVLTAESAAQLTEKVRAH
jgi:hypothetical protein